MKVVPQVPVSARNQDGSPVAATPQAKPVSLRDRAMAAYKNAEADTSLQNAARLLSGQTPAVNQNSVSVEELKAVTPPESPQKDTSIEPGVATDSVEATEAPKEETPPAKEESPLSTQYAVLARKEKQLRAKFQAQESAFKAKEAALAEREAALTAKDSQYKSDYISKSRFKEDAISALSDVGLSYDEITQLALQPKVSTDPAVLNLIKQMEAKIQALEGDSKSVKQTYEDGQKQQYQQALNNIKSEVQTLVNSDPEFETIKATNSHQDVVDLIEAEFKESGRLMTNEEAAKLVEDHLVEEAMKIAKIKKIQTRLGTIAQTPKPATEGAKPTQTQSKTLTNSMTASRPLSARERAILAFENKLNK